MHMKNGFPGILKLTRLRPKQVYTMGLVLTLAALLAFALLEKVTLFGPIGLSLLFMGYAEQTRIDAGSTQKGILHVISCAVFVVTAAYVLWLDW